MFEQWKSIQKNLRRAQRFGKKSEDVSGKSVFELEQVKETVNEADQIDDEILSINNRIKFKSTVLYVLTNAMTLLQLLALFAMLDWFVFLCIIVGHLVGFLLFGFQRNRSFLYIYNPLGSIV